MLLWEGLIIRQKLCILSLSDYGNLFVLKTLNYALKHIKVSNVTRCFAGVKHVVNISTKGRSSMHARRLFRMSCTWGCLFSGSTSNVLGVLLKLPSRLAYFHLISLFYPVKGGNHSCLFVLLSGCPSNNSVTSWVTIIDRSRKYRLRNGARGNSKLSSREVDWRGGEKNSTGEGGRGTE